MSAVEIPQPSCALRPPGSFLNIQILGTPHPLPLSDSVAVDLGWGLRN